MPTGVYKRTIEHRNKLSTSLKGKTNRGSFCKGRKPWNYGKKYSFSEEAKKNISKGMMGRFVSEKTKEKQRISMTGKKLSDSHKIDCSCSFCEVKRGDAIGKKHPAFKENKAKTEYSKEWTSDLRNSIRIRDNFTCQHCGTHQKQLKSILSVHHIDYNKKNCQENNLISLCKKCHGRTNSLRTYWEPCFEILFILNKKYDDMGFQERCRLYEDTKSAHLSQ